MRQRKKGNEIMEVIIILLCSALALWINYLIAREFYNAAEEKGYYDTKYLWICFFLGIVGYLLIIALPARSKKFVEASDDLPPL
jgi:hypothetical protein